MSSSSSPSPSHLPSMIVFDLDDCLWTPEMHELPGDPEIPVEGKLTNGARGVVGMRVPRGPMVRLFDGARQVLYELASDPKYSGIALAAASSSLEPRYSYMCLEGIEILPGLTLRDMFQYDQIGRSGKLSPNKITHFRELHRETQIPYDEMLFFDDCNWGDHCAAVTKEFGVVSYRTPYGLQYDEFQEALDKYRRVKLQKSS